VAGNTSTAATSEGMKAHVSAFELLADCFNANNVLQICREVDVIDALNAKKHSHVGMCFLLPYLLLTRAKYPASDWYQRCLAQTRPEVCQ
jgi:hypothetical protein